MWRKLLCCLGLHDDRFAFNHYSLVYKRNAAGLFICERCNRQRWVWYLWVKRKKPQDI